MSLAMIVQARQRILLNEFVSRTAPLVAVENFGMLSKLTSLLPEFLDDGLNAGRLARRQTKNVCVLCKPGCPPDTASVWVRNGYTDYRGAFVHFLTTVYGFSANKAELDLYHADHLLNQKRAPNDTVMLRLELCLKSVNSRWGASIEKAATRANLTRNNAERRSMSFIVAAKIAGFAPPTSLEDPVSRDLLAREFARLGMSLAEAQSGLDGELGHIARNLR